MNYKKIAKRELKIIISYLKNRKRCICSKLNGKEKLNPKFNKNAIDSKRILL